MAQLKHMKYFSNRIPDTYNECIDGHNYYKNNYSFKGFMNRYSKINLYDQITFTEMKIFIYNSIINPYSIEW